MHRALALGNCRSVSFKEAFPNTLVVTIAITSEETRSINIACLDGQSRLLS